MPRTEETIIPVRSTIFSCLVLACIGLAPAFVSAQSMEAIDSKHVFEDANLVVVFQLQRLQDYLDEDVKEGLTSTHDWLENVIHLPTADCKEIILQFGASEYSRDAGYKAMNETFGIAFRCEEEISDQAITEFCSLLVLSETTHNEKIYYERNGGRPAFYFDGNSVLLCESNRTNSVIDSETKSEDREVAIVENVSRETDLSVQVDFESETFRGFFPYIFHGIPEFGDAECLTVIAKNASSASLNIALDSMRPFTIEVAVSESGDIDELKQAVEDFAEVAQQFVDTMRREITRGAPSPDLAQAAEDFAKSFVEWLAEPEVTSDTDSVTLQFADADAGKQTLNNFVKIMNALHEQFGG